jgi:hypothetical protein
MSDKRQRSHMKSVPTQTTTEDAATAVARVQMLIDAYANMQLDFVDLAAQWRAKAESIERHPQNSLLTQPPQIVLFYLHVADELEAVINRYQPRFSGD